MANTLITLAIHTYDYAVALRELLASHGIDSVIDNINIKNPSTAVGVRVRINEKNLPQALRIVESNPITSTIDELDSLEGVNGKILVPIDFSESSLNAVKAAFAFALPLRLEPVLIHVYASPYYDDSIADSENYTINLQDAQMQQELADGAAAQMSRFRKMLDKLIKDGELPKIKYSSLLREGLPEEVILNYARITPPRLIVMTTRSVQRKASQMIGSVAAEVIDACRVPVLTIPEDFNFQSLEQLDVAAFFANVDRRDMLAMDMYVDLMASAHSSLCIIPVKEKLEDKELNRLKSLVNYFAGRYPDFKFSYEIPDLKNLRDELKRISSEKKIKLVVVPNKKKNIFARLINPGIAHKVIFESDMPLLALPV